MHINVMLDINIKLYYYFYRKYYQVCVFLSMQIIITDSYYPVFQSISPGLVKTNMGADSKEVMDYFKDCSFLEPKDIANGVIYALGTRPEVQVQIVNVFVS